jgi:hypothetical protein
LYSAPPVSSPSQYEFDPVESRAIDKVAGRTLAWGIMSLVVGILSAVGLGVAVAFRSVLVRAVPPMLVDIAIVAMVPLVLVNLVVAGLYISSGSALGRVMSSKGNDVAHLVAGLDKMGSAFRIEAIISVVAFVLGLGLGVMLVSSGGVS